MDVLGHWLSVMHVHDTAAGVAGTGCSGGWLPREQILGEEARRRVPAAFMAQVSLDVVSMQQFLYSGISRFDRARTGR